MTNEYIIYTRRVAYELRKLGFKIFRVEPNPNKPEFDCWVFENTDEFQAALSLISAEKKGGSRNGR